VLGFPERRERPEGRSTTGWSERYDESSKPPIESRILTIPRALVHVDEKQNRPDFDDDMAPPQLVAASPPLPGHPSCPRRDCHCRCRCSQAASRAEISCISIVVTHRHDWCQRAHCAHRPPSHPSPLTLPMPLTQGSRHLPSLTVDKIHTPITLSTLVRPCPTPPSLLISIVSSMRLMPTRAIAFTAIDIPCKSHPTRLTPRSRLPLILAGGPTYNVNVNNDEQRRFRGCVIGKHVHWRRGHTISPMYNEITDGKWVVRTKPCLSSLCVHSFVLEYLLNIYIYIYGPIPMCFHMQLYSRGICE
jgi:hypothetical protein